MRIFFSFSCCIFILLVSMFSFVFVSFCASPPACPIPQCRQGEARLLVAPFRFNHSKSFSLQLGKCLKQGKYVFISTKKIIFLDASATETCAPFENDLLLANTCGIIRPFLGKILFGPIPILSFQHNATHVDSQIFHLTLLDFR